MYWKKKKERKKEVVFEIKPHSSQEEEKTKGEYGGKMLSKVEIKIVWCQGRYSYCYQIYHTPPHAYIIIQSKVL